MQVTLTIVNTVNKLHLIVIGERERERVCVCVYVFTKSSCSALPCQQERNFS